MSEDAEDGDVPKKKVSGKRLILIIGLLVIIIGGAAGAVIGLGLLDSIMGGEPVEEEVVEEEAPPEVDPVGVFYPMEEITVSLDIDSSRKPILVLELTIEVEDDAAVARIEQVRPRLISEFNSFMQGLRAEELNGSEGAYLLREELYRRASQVLAPTPVKNLLITSYLVRSQYTRTQKRRLAPDLLSLIGMHEGAYFERRE